MRRLWLITKVMLKTSSTSAQLSISKRKWVNLIFYAVLLVSILPSFGLLYWLVDNMITMLKVVNQQAVVINLVVTLNTILIFLLSLLVLPTIYFFSKDVELYLPLPIKPFEIISGKFIVALLMEYVILLFSYVPPVLAYVKHEPTLFMIVGFTIVFFLLPILPLLVASLIILLGTRYIPFMKNKNYMTIFIGTLSLVFAVALSIVIQNTSISFESQEMLHLILTGGVSLASTMFTFLPPVRFVANFIVNNSYVSLLLFALSTAAMYALFLFIADKIYFITVTSIQESKTTNRKITVNRQNRSSRNWAYFKKELWLLIRTPAYLMNNVLPAFIVPILMVVPFFLSDASEGAEIMQMIKDFQMPKDLIIPIGILLGAGLAIFNSGSNMTSATAISRDKHQINHNLSIPFPYYQQLIIKSLVGSLITLLANGFILFVIAMFFPSLLMIVLIALLPCVIVTVSLNLLAVYIDAWLPRLRWENEQQAVKNNWNGMITMFGSWTLLGLTVLLYFQFEPPLLLFSLGIFLLFVGLGLLIYNLIKKQEDTLRDRIMSRM